MKRIILLISCILIAVITNAQVWTGNISTDWNTAGNWNTNSVPTSGSSITIPGGAIPNWPKFATDVVVNGIILQIGSKLDVNGFTLTSNQQINFSGAEINNSSAVTDIVITTAGSALSLIGNTVFNDVVIFNHGSTDILYEGYYGPDHFKNNAIFNAVSSGKIILSHQNASVFDADVIVNRTVSGPTDLFVSGGTVAGNFSYTNNVGGASAVGGNFVTTTINGKLDLTSILPAGNPGYTISRIKNLLTGGTVNIQNAGFINAVRDTLKLSSFSMTNFRNGATNDINYNDIISPVTLSDYSSSANDIFIRNNKITGNVIIDFNGSGNIYEAYQGPNNIIGNVTYNVNGPGVLYHSYQYFADNIITGNFTVNRNSDGNTTLFGSGGTLNGDFSYTNNSGGITQIGNESLASTISGNITLSSDFSANIHNYAVTHIINQGGGSINIKGPNVIKFLKDTIKAPVMNVTDIKNGAISDFDRNDLTGNLTVSDNAVVGSYFYFRANKITGNTIFNRNSSQPMYEAYQGGNLMVGNTTFNLNGSGDLFTSYDGKSVYQGNLVINRTVAGNSKIFYARGADISGNFSYTSNTGGAHDIGNTTYSVHIGGAVNINADFGALSPTINIVRLINQTNSGNINIKNAGSVGMNRDTLKMAAITITGLKNNSIGDIINNQLEGPFTMSDDATLGNYTYFRGNTMLGPVIFNRNSSQPIFEAYQFPNNFSDNVTYNQNGTGAINLCYDDSSFYAKNLTLNINSNLDIRNRIKFYGSGNSTFQQLGSVPLNIGVLTVAKTGTGKLILGSPLTISSNLAFKGGNIQSSIANPVNFLNNATYSDATVTSHITGPVTKTGNDAFTFPVGNETSLNSVSITAPANVNDKFSVQYIYGNPATNGYDTAQRVAALKRISGCEYWDLKRETGSSNVSLTLAYSGLCTTGGYYITDPSKARVAHWNGTLWEDLGNGGSSGTINGTVATAAPVTDFSPFTIASTDVLINALPLRLISFTAYRQNNQVYLKWQTENESALSGFEIETSEDGIRFTRLGFVHAANNSGRNNYNSIDNDPVKGINFYRLKQMDVNGNFSYSNVVKVDMSGNGSILISPNPATEKITVSGGKTGDLIRVINAQGQEVCKTIVTATSQSLSITKLNAGVYMLQLVSGKNVQTMQFVKY